jgi:hypothetical protein
MSVGDELPNLHKIVAKVNERGDAGSTGIASE